MQRDGNGLIQVLEISFHLISFYPGYPAAGHVLHRNCHVMNGVSDSYDRR